MAAGSGQQGLAVQNLYCQRNSGTRTFPNVNSGMLISNCNRNSIRKSLQSKEPPKAVGKILFSTSALQASRDNSTMALLVCLQQCLQTVIYREQRVQRSELWSHPTCSWYSAVFRQELSFQTGIMGPSAPAIPVQRRHGITGTTLVKDHKCN